jgi:tripartite-type tricarboxylate transporter receptor subunit TctC
MIWNRLAALLVAGIALLAGVADLRAQTYPSRPIKFIVGFPAGGPTDVLARLVGQFVTERIGQQVVIENKPGAGSNIATEAAINAPADGYSILVCATVNAINPTLYRTLPFDFLRDMTAVAGLARVPNTLSVHPSVPAKTVAEFISYAKANAGKVNMASSGNGTTVHLSGELFKSMTGVELVHVPYRGSAPAMTDLVGGQVPVMFADVPTALVHIQSGAIRALGVTTANRLDTLPGVPPIADTVPGYEASAWFGFAAPKATPADAIQKLNVAINAALTDPKVAARIAELGSTPIVVSPNEFGAFLAAETEKWAKVVRFSGAKVD